MYHLQCHSMYKCNLVQFGLIEVKAKETIYFCSAILKTKVNHLTTTTRLNQTILLVV